MDTLFGGIDVGSESHHVVVMNHEGKILYDGKVAHRFSAFHEAIVKFKGIEEKGKGKIAFAMEGKNGYGSPFDRLLLGSGFTLYNVDNLKLKHFREVFGAEWRNDKRDATMLAKLLRAKEGLETPKEKAFTPIQKVPVRNETLKILSRHQSVLIDEKVKMQNRLSKKVLEICPGWLDIGDGDDKTFLRLLVAYPNVSEYKNIKEHDVLNIKGIGAKRCKELWETLKKLDYVEELSDVYAILMYSYAKRILELKEEIEALDKKLDEIGYESKEVKQVRSIPGVATKLSSRLIGEIGDIKRFSNQNELAVYCGVGCLNDDSGKKEKTKAIHKANKICKQTMIEIAGCTIRYVPESKDYYAKKRAEGKDHNKALRCLARQLIKVIFKLLTENYEYKIKEIPKKAA